MSERELVMKKYFGIPVIIMMFCFVMLIGCKETPKAQQSQPSKPAVAPKEGKPAPKSDLSVSSSAQSQPADLAKSIHERTEKRKKDFPLHYAVEQGDLEAVTKLLNSGTDPNIKDDQGFVPLHWAAQRNKPDIAKALIAKKANVNEKDAKDLTPMHKCAFMGYIDVAKVLLENGADINAKEKNGLTPLTVAKKMQRKDMIDFLTSKGAKE
jgi:ankyrin repeat protein